MKKYITALACVIALCSFTVSYGQLVDVAISKDSSIGVDKVYAGVLAITSYAHDTNQFNKYASFRVGASGFWKLGNHLTLRTWVAADYEANTSKSASYQAYWMQYSPFKSKKMLLEGGVGPTLVAGQHRPHPAAHDGQFEAWSKAQLPGVAPVLAVKMMPAKEIMFGVGVSLRQDYAEYQATLTIKSLKLSAYHQVFDTTTALVAEYNADRWGVIALWKIDKVVGGLAYYVVSSDQKISVYTDLGYSLTNDPTKDALVRCEAGFLKSYHTKYVKLRLGAGWSYEMKSVKGYLQISL